MKREKLWRLACRALGDDQPKYLNSPETPIYSKSNVLYHLDRAKEALRRADFAVLVEGYMDAIAVARAGISNVVASCGTSLAEPQIKLLSRFTKRVIVNYDPDTAGQIATERSISLLLENDFEVRVLALPAMNLTRRRRHEIFEERRSGPLYTRNGRGGLYQAAEGGAAVCGLPDRDARGTWTFHAAKGNCAR